jgi:predicted ATPase/class 3 adenylate cyclase/DNA-binding CsgD family transcriptional regulator
VRDRRIYAFVLMFYGPWRHMLASMSEIDPCADTPLMDWNELDVSGLLPTGTVTLLLADVEGSTRLWETQPEEMATAIARLNQTVSEIIVTHDGVRPVEQGEGDSFVAAFSRASDAVAAAFEIQRSPLAPIRLRIGVHTGEIRLRDEGNYAGPTINRTARLRDLGHGGQTLLSGTTEDLVADRLPADSWLTDLGAHELRGVPRPERVVQLCHPDLVNEFPPLRTTKAVVSHSLPLQLTSFVGRQAELDQVRDLLAENRLVTLTGAGGVGKTRLSIQVAGQLLREFDDGVWYVDLAPITNPDLVPSTVARALGLPDQPGSSPMDTLTRFVGGRQMLVVLDNCEHLLDACAALVVALLSIAEKLTLLATSREPIAAAGEVSWRLPSLSLADEAIELFTDRARRARADFAVTGDNASALDDICRRLDGLPLAIELAAARVRAMSLPEILDSLHDRFRLLTGGARTTVRRQQTLRASVDWSHALLTEPERVLFRRLAVFVGGFDLEAAQAISGNNAVERYQALDQLTLLVDKSLVLADNSGGRTRYRLLETVRQYAAEKLSETGEANDVRARHRNHYASLAQVLDTPGHTDDEQRVEQAQTEIDNLRAAFGWSLENSKFELALAMASSLQPLWLAWGRVEGLAWFDAALTKDQTKYLQIAPRARARAFADRTTLAFAVSATGDINEAEHALAIAREAGDPTLLAKVLTACGQTAVHHDVQRAGSYFAEAVALARELGDPRELSQILGILAIAAHSAGNPIAARAAAEEGLSLASALGDRLNSRRFRWTRAMAQCLQGEVAEAAEECRELAAEAEQAHDAFYTALSLAGRSAALACKGEATAAGAAADATLKVATQLGQVMATAYWTAAEAALAAGDAASALESAQKAWQQPDILPGNAAVARAAHAQALLARGGDLAAARRLVDDAAALAPESGWWLIVSLATRARVAIAQNALEQAERDAHDALRIGADLRAKLCVPDIFESLAILASKDSSYREAARLLGSAHAIRREMGSVRYKVWDAGYEASAAAVREALGESDFDSAWAEGAGLSIEEAIAYAQRGRGQRKRPTSGWGSLTPTELDVVRLVSEGLTNNDIATRLFVSPRTVQTHLTHVYTKLGLTSRVQLVQEAARH